MATLGPHTKMIGNQHYVPQFLLKGFCHGKRKQIYTFDKHKGKIFRSSLRNIAQERNFYELDDIVNPSLDDWLEKCETQVAPIVQSIRDLGSIEQLTSVHKEWIAIFVCVQILRTPAYRNRTADMHLTMAEAIMGKGGTLAEVKNFPPLTIDELREISIVSIPDMTRDLYPIILDKSWLLFEACDHEAFWISDNPVTMANTTNAADGIRSKVGLAVEGIEIYLPISDRLLLGFMCSSIEKMIRKGKEAAGMFDFPAPKVVADLDAGFRAKKPISLTKENIVFNNSLQVEWSERFVFSPYNDFGLAEDMITRDPALKIGPRVKIQ